MIVEYHPLSVSDLNRAVSYYNRQRQGLGEELRAEVYETIARIRSNPLQVRHRGAGYSPGFCAPISLQRVVSCR